MIAFYIAYYKLLYSLGTDVFNKHMASNLSTVAVVPMTSDVPISNFTGRLTAAIKSIGMLIRVHTCGVFLTLLACSNCEKTHECINTRRTRPLSFRQVRVLMYIHVLVKARTICICTCTLYVLVYSIGYNYS